MGCLLTICFDFYSGVGSYGLTTFGIGFVTDVVYDYEISSFESELLLPLPLEL